MSGLSILDFNTFRSKVEDGFNIVDQKIRDILDVVEPSCPKTLSTLIMALNQDCGLKSISNNRMGAKSLKNGTFQVGSKG